ncbi:MULTISPECIES: matrixin family metalloprotease [Lactobacillaceae]|uniref:matrixin family metalloprotease n=1 Tax=Lactobacillaceae TaxID=33958 RepID=UPI00145759F3|nr:matrixin family metalloprotease [Lactobacillus sp. HBUAS51381]NLR08513.1 matrixin family metalloprotease [Lactobacillus sp. HBUAS51381]
MTRSTWYKKIVIAIVAIGLFVSQIGGAVASAATTTPFGPERFAQDHATYAITTKSGYYQQIWRSAIKAWNKTGAFTFRLASQKSAQIKLSTASKSQARRLGMDVGLTEFWARNDYFYKINSELNPSLLHSYGYSRSDDLHVAEHELGHTMGLAHNPSKHSVMYYQNRSVGIQQVDINGVKKRYQTPAGQAS